MRALSVLGSSSNAGKSWVTTALCAWLRQKGVSVAPFKAQNMANNAYATIEGGEIGVAQAVQAEACGLRPIAEMNPVLLKPSGENVSQVIRMGKAIGHVSSAAHYRMIEDSWSVVSQALDWWQDRCDVLIMEGAGSPVELNLMERDIVNLRPMRYVDGKWILVANIELGGVFAQVVGTHSLLPADDQARGLGFVVNRFRGDLGLFSTASAHFKQCVDLPYLGVLPLEAALRIEDEDSMNAAIAPATGDEPFIAWIRYPSVSISQDMDPWRDDNGISCRWVDKPQQLAAAAAVVLPGSKNTIADLHWLRERGLEQPIVEAARRGRPTVGICGGYQMLGLSLVDPIARKDCCGLGLLSMKTEFAPRKTVVRRVAVFEEDEWETYEIHTGITRCQEGDFDVKPLLALKGGDGNLEAEGARCGNIWGCYQHGFFESPAARRSLVAMCQTDRPIRVDSRPYRSKKQQRYKQMARFIEERLDLEPIKRYLEL